MPNDVERDIQNLLADRGFTLGTGAQQLANDARPATADPYQQAYDDINKITEQTYAEIIASPLASENQLEVTRQLALQSKQATDAVTQAKDPENIFGGHPLISAFESQGNFPIDAQTFQRRTQLAGILQQANPEKFDEMMVMREKLSESDRALFDRGFEQEFGVIVEDSARQAAAEASPTGATYSSYTPRATDFEKVSDNEYLDTDRWESPRQKELWEEFMGIDSEYKPGYLGFFQKVLGFDDDLRASHQYETYLREQKGDEWVDAQLPTKIRMSRKAADGLKTVAAGIGQSIAATYKVASAVDPISFGRSQVIESTTGANTEQQAEIVKQVSEQMVNDSFRPEMIAAMAFSAGLGNTATGLRASQQIAAHTLAEGAIGGMANAGYAWAVEDQDSIQQLADDFVIGAFLDASFTTVLAGFAGMHTTKYNREALRAALENSSAKNTDLLASSGSEHVLVLDAAPKPANLVDVRTRTASPSGTHFVDDDLAPSIHEAQQLLDDANYTSAAAATELNQLQQLYNKQGRLRDQTDRLLRAGQKAPDAGQLVSQNQIAVARERAARLAENARQAAVTMKSLADYNAIRAQSRMVQNVRAGLGLDVDSSAKSVGGIVTITPSSPLFRGIDTKFATGDNPLAAPTRSVNVTTSRPLAEGFAAGQDTPGTVVEARAVRDLRFLEEGTPEYRKLLDEIENNEDFQKLPFGQRQSAIDTFIESKGYDGAVRFNDGLPAFRAFDKNNFAPVNQINKNVDEIDKLAKLTDDEVTAQMKGVDNYAKQFSDPLNSPYAIRRMIHHTAAAISGRLPGSMQFIADAAQSLTHSLDELTNPIVEKLASQADSLLKKELDKIVYIGPAQFRKYADAYKREIFLSRPDYFRGQSALLTNALRNVQRLGDAKVKSLEKLGYNIKEIEGYYFPQFWENDPKSVDAVLRGKVSVAKERTFGDVIEGLQNGLMPRAMSVRDILVSHDKMLNQAFGDVTFKNTSIQRGLIKKGAPSIANGTYSINSPMFKGLVADKNVARSIDTYFTAPPTSVQNFRSVAGRVKNTTFGLFDLGVFGIQGASAIMKGGWAAVVGEMTQKMMVRSLRGAEQFDADDATFWKVLFTRNGGRLGTVSSGYDFEAGTLVGMLPTSGAKKIDRAITEGYMDRLSTLQFDKILTPVRLSIFKGHLFAQKLLGQDISDPRTLKAAAEAANRATLTSRGAQKSTQRGLEAALFTSTQALRAESASIFQPFYAISDSVLKRKLNGPELITAAVTLTHLAAMFYGIQAAADYAQGREPEVFNPANKEDWKNFGYVRVGDKRIALIKERTLIRGMEQSYEALRANDPEKVAEIWSKVAIGKLSPLVGASASLATGYGYDTQGFFQTGELDTQSKLLNFVPFPLIVEKFALQPTFRTDYVAISLESFGFNNYDIGVVDRRNEYLKVNNPYAPDDPRFKDVQEFGYAGMEKAEAQQFKQDHPEFFNGKNNLSTEQEATFARAEQIRTNMMALENEVRLDPFKRRDYADRRRDLVKELGQLFKDSTAKDVTLQDKATSLYYDTINEYEKLAVGEVLSGDMFGEAEAEAKRRVNATLGEQGVAALERGLVVGTTELDTEYRTARKRIEDEGYYDIADAIVANVSKGLWPTFKDFTDSLGEFSKEKGVVPEQTPAYRDMQSLITDAKEKYRERNPEIDALLVIWDGLTPRSVESAKAASAVLGRNIQLAKDVQDKMKKEAKEEAEAVGRNQIADYEDIIKAFE